jgi:hypothetical protein
MLVIYKNLLLIFEYYIALSCLLNARKYVYRIVDPVLNRKQTSWQTKFWLPALRATLARPWSKSFRQQAQTSRSCAVKQRAQAASKRASLILQTWKR